MDYNAMRAQFAQKGYVVVRNLLSEDEVKFYTDRLEAMSGINRQTQAAAARHGFDQKGLGQSWNMPDGVSKNADFWSLITNQQLTGTVRELLGPDIRYLQHSDLHVGFSAVSWHRDSVNRKFGQGPDWDESEAPYRLVRVGVYLQTYEESHFRLGFIPGSHQPENPVSLGRKWTERKLELIGAMSYLSAKVQMWASNADWVPTEPGDCIIFDPRTLHSGSYILGPKYSLFVGYGIENKHFYNHRNYYRYVREELGYEDLPPDLVTKLQAANLYPEDLQDYQEVEGAWVPASVIKNYFGPGLKKLTRQN